MRFELNPHLDEGLRATLVDLWTEVTDAGGAVGFAPPADREAIEEVADYSFERVSKGHEDIIIGFDGDEPFGFGFLVRRPGPLFRHWVTVKRFMVRPSLQRRGLGSALLEAIHEKAMQLGIEQIHLTVRGGTGTEAFYDRHGYVIHARIPDMIRVAPGDDREEIYMVKRLRSRS